MEHQLSVRPIQKTDIPLLVDYWMIATDEYLTGMGADISKMPDRAGFTNMLEQQIQLDIKEKPSYALIWLIDGVPSGHCNVNNILYGKEARMHLHLWKPVSRKKGMGTELVKLSVKHFFEMLELQQLWCEPYALNPAPQNVLKRAGFQFIKKYRTIPGSINFEQEVNQWLIKREEVL